MLYSWSVNCLVGNEPILNCKEIKVKKIILAVLFLAASQVNAGIIIAVGDSNISSNANSTFFNNVFGSQNVIGLNSTIDPWALDNWDTTATATAASYSQSTSLTSTALAGADWLIAASGSAYDNATMQLIANFLSAGGNLWVGGEAQVFASFAPANQLLSFLGSTMSLNPVDTSSYNSSTNTNLDPYTVGTTGFSAVYQSTISGGVALYASNSNAVVSIDRTTFASAVPAPSMLAIFGIAFAGLALSRKR